MISSSSCPLSSSCTLEPQVCIPSAHSSHLLLICSQTSLSAVVFIFIFSTFPSCLNPTTILSFPMSSSNFPRSRPLSPALSVVVLESISPLSSLKSMSMFSLLTVFILPIILYILSSMMAPPFSCFILSSTSSFHTPTTLSLTSPTNVPFNGSSPLPVILIVSLRLHSSLSAFPVCFAGVPPPRPFNIFIPSFGSIITPSPNSCVLGPIHSNLILFIALSAIFQFPSIHSSLLAISH